MSGHNCIFWCNHIPIINVLGPSSDDYLVRLLTSFFGGTIIVATGLIQLTKAYENWINYRNTAVQLKQEYQLFALKAEDYSDEKIPDISLSSMRSMMVVSSARFFASVFSPFRQTFCIAPRLWHLQYHYDPSWMMHLPLFASFLYFSPFSQESYFRSDIIAGPSEFG
jgi:Protein of unknown function (DUF4231)